MTLLKWLRTRWHQAAPVLERPAVFPIARPTPPVPAAYLSLYTYLDRRYASVVVLTFEQLEALLGFALPTPACTERDWWTDAGHTNRLTEAWTGAGRTAMPNLSARTVTFERTAQS
jgi:hypothetical protein